MSSLWTCQMRHSVTFFRSPSLNPAGSRTRMTQPECLSKLGENGDAPPTPTRALECCPWAWAELPHTADRPRAAGLWGNQTTQREALQRHCDPGLWVTWGAAWHLCKVCDVLSERQSLTQNWVPGIGVLLQQKQKEVALVERPGDKQSWKNPEGLLRRGCSGRMLGALLAGWLTRYWPPLVSWAKQISTQCHPQ